MADLLLWIPLLLLGGAVISGAMALMSSRGRSITEMPVSLVSCAAPIVAFALSFLLFRHVQAEGKVTHDFFTWFRAGDLSVAFTMGADSLTCVMLLVITGVGSLIHVYSVGYMKGDANYARYFSFLNLFVALMSVLVLGRNLLVLFVGWEGVGLCSYLLIGFWWKDPAKAGAGMKAFVVNRIGDAGFLLGLFALWRITGTLDIDQLAGMLATDEWKTVLLADSGFLGLDHATLIGLLLFIGATGKSAQIPLYVWLPDAMAGPTPVSALIHAATMVTAGVYLVGRLSFLYALSPIAQGTILIVGAATCLIAGLLATVKFDIKKVLAYSTISQIGYMFIGVSTGEVGSGIMHVMTHAFFKACLFLGAGSVIHALHHEQDLRKMGGLARKMPWTCAVMTVSAAAMAGVPPLSGFFSKDAVLWYAFSTDLALGRVAWLMAMIGALLTGFYMFRLIFLTFAGSYRGTHEGHEVPGVMLWPKRLLALGAVAIGFVGVPKFLGGSDAFATFVHESVPAGALPHSAQGHHPASHLALEWSLMLLSVLVGAAGIAAAWYCFVKRPQTTTEVGAKVPRLHAALKANLHVDEFYDRHVVGSFTRFARAVHDFLDVKVIDALVNGTGSFARRVGSWVAWTQTGVVRGYVALMVVGTLLLLLTVLR